jgi:hypothetical protein
MIEEKFEWREMVSTAPYSDAMLRHFLYVKKYSALLKQPPIGFSALFYYLCG